MKKYLFGIGILLHLAVFAQISENCIDQNSSNIFKGVAT